MLQIQFSKLITFSVISLALSGIAVAQYGGGGTGGTGSGGGTYSSSGRSYGHGALIGGVVAGAVGGTVLFLVLRHHHHNNKEVVGCVGPDGQTLNADNGEGAYQLFGAPMTAGEHLSVVGKKIKGDSGVDELQVFSVKKDLGQCGLASALVEQHP